MGCCCTKKEVEETATKKEKGPGLKPIMGNNCQIDLDTDVTEDVQVKKKPERVNIFTFSVRAKPKKKKKDVGTETCDILTENDPTGPQKLNLGRVVLIPTGTMVKIANKPSDRRARFSHKRDESAARPDKRRQELVHEKIYELGGYIQDNKGNRVYIEPGTPYPGSIDKENLVNNDSSEDTESQE